jgi:hypothetical protein
MCKLHFPVSERKKEQVEIDGTLRYEASQDSNREIYIYARALGWSQEQVT